MQISTASTRLGTAYPAVLGEGEGTAASRELGGEATQRFRAGLGNSAVSGEPSSGLTLAHGIPPSPHPLLRATIKWEGSQPRDNPLPALDPRGCLPGSREQGASGELCFLASGALQSPGCHQETGGQCSPRLGTTAGAACQLQEPLLWQRREREWQSCLVAAHRCALRVWSMAAEGRGRALYN